MCMKVYERIWKFMFLKNQSHFIDKCLSQCYRDQKRDRDNVFFQNEEYKGFPRPLFSWLLQALFVIIDLVQQQNSWECSSVKIQKSIRLGGQIGVMVVCGDCIRSNFAVLVYLYVVLWMCLFCYFVCLYSHFVCIRICIAVKLVLCLCSEMEFRIRSYFAV